MKVVKLAVASYWKEIEWSRRSNTNSKKASGESCLNKFALQGERERERERERVENG